MADWYYAKDGERHGPVSPAELKKMAASGELEPTDQVFQEGGSQWVEASSIKGLFSASGVANKPSAAARRDEPEPARARGRRGAEDEVDEVDEEEAPRPKRSVRSSSSSQGDFGDLLMFRRFVAPIVVMVLFWIGVAGMGVYALILGIAGIAAMTQSGVMGLFIIVGAIILVPLGIMYVRLLCEMMIVIFRIYDVLVDIQHELRRSRR